MIFAKKSLGQNFLRSDKALRQIVEAADIHEGETVLEIGPGEGVLTRALIQKGARIIAVEKDNRLIPLLQETFAEEILNKKLTLIHADVLDTSFADLGLVDKQFKVVANIPYYITGALLPLILESTIQPSRAVVLVQKEVALRVLARDHKESILSMSIKAYGTPRIIDYVPAGAFVPAPNVDSAILCIEDISKNFFTTPPTITETAFFNSLKRGFAHKRKLLRSNLHLTDEQMTAAHLSPQARAEDITLADWKRLAEIDILSVS